MTITLSGINYWAVLVSALAAFFLGGIWYQALFGKLWQRLHGYSDEKLKEMQAKRPPAMFFGGMIAAYLVLAFALAVLYVSCGVNSAATGALVGFLIWLGPAAAITYTAYLASEHPIGVFMLNASYQLVFLIMMGAILGGWR